MNVNEQRQVLASAVRAARAAGQIMRENLAKPKKICAITQHDIKLALDVRCQTRIEGILLRALPQASVLGEEGVAGEAASRHRWVVDPIDGTVNFTYGIPHACVSIALQAQPARRQGPSAGSRAENRGLALRHSRSTANYQTLLGVVYDPFREELWTARHGQPARLNGKIIHVSHRRRLAEAIVTLGFSKSPARLKEMVRVFNRLILRVRKLRIMGAGALDLAYVACGRMDAYLEPSVRLWDIAAGGLILECAGGEFWHEALPGDHVYRVIANNGRLRRQLPKFD